MGAERADRLDYNHAFAGASAAHEAVMAPARVDYNAAIALAKASKTLLTPADIAVWWDACDRALAAYRWVLAEHGFEGQGERLA